jgi:hypothetical protein
MRTILLVVATFLQVAAVAVAAPLSTHMCKIQRSLVGTVVAYSVAFDAIADDKLTNLPAADMAKIVAADITERQALITADFTRAIYSEKASFQDEIDTYPIDKYVQGTKALFNAGKSHVDLVGPVEANDKEVNFKFQETLAFNIPFNPKVTLSGKVTLTRGDGGLVVYSREFWDQSVPDVLKTVTF